MNRTKNVPERIVFIVFNQLVLTHVSEDGWQGHRGTVMIKAIFELKKDNSFHVTYWATSTIPTSINLSLNLFLNLAGHVSLDLLIG